MENMLSSVVFPGHVATKAEYWLARCVATSVLRDNSASRYYQNVMHNGHPPMHAMMDINIFPSPARGM